MTEHIPDLRIEAVKQEAGPDLLRIEQTDSSGQSYVIDLHPLHVHYLAERLGIVSAAQRGALEEVRALRRRMLVLRDRIDELDDFLHASGHDWENEILQMLAYSSAASQFANEFCADVPVMVEGT